MTDSRGYRGYITSRPVRGQETPHQVQNMIVREYCRRNDLLFLLSVTEYSVPSCFMMLTDLLNTADSYDGIVLYSQFLLPESVARRQAVYHHVLSAGAELHAALENTAIRTESDIQAFEDAIAVVNALPLSPMAGHYNKTNEREDLKAFRALVL